MEEPKEHWLAWVRRVRAACRSGHRGAADLGRLFHLRPQAVSNGSASEATLYLGKCELEGMGSTWASLVALKTAAPPPALHRATVALFDGSHLKGVPSIRFNNLINYYIHDGQGLKA